MKEFELKLFYILAFLPDVDDGCGRLFCQEHRRGSGIKVFVGRAANGGNAIETGRVDVEED
jgi:hypothetical protein